MNTKLKSILMAALFVVPVINVTPAKAAGTAPRAWYESIPYSPIAVFAIFGCWFLYRFKNPIREYFASKGDKRKEVGSDIRAAIPKAYAKDRGSILNWFGLGGFGNNPINIPDAEF